MDRTIVLDQLRPRPRPVPKGRWRRAYEALSPRHHRRRAAALLREQRLIHARARIAAGVAALWDRLAFDLLNGVTPV